MRHVMMLLLATSVVGCTDQGAALPDVMVQDDQSKSDSASGRLISPVYTSEVHLSEVTATGSATVVSEAANTLTVRSPLYVLPRKDGTTVAASIDTTDPGLADTGLFTPKMGFLLFHRVPGAAAWNQMIMDVITPESILHMNYFYSISISGNQISADLPDVFGTTVNNLVGVGDNDEFAVFPIPASDWGSLAGDYGYTLTASCGGTPCN